MLRSLLIAILIFGALPAIVLYPQVGILVWSWISYMNPHRLTYGFAYQFPFLDFVAAATMLGFMVGKGRKSLPNHPLVWLLSIYYFWTTITLIFAVYPERALEKWIVFTKIILFTYLTIFLMQSKVRLHALIWVIVLSVGFFTTKGGIFTVLGGGVGRVWGPAGSFLADNNHFALAAVMFIPLVRYLHTQAQNKYIRWGLLAMIGFGFFAIFGTQSRGALVAITAMLIFLTWKSKRFGFGIMASVVAVIIGLVFMPDEWRERMSTIQNYEEDASAQGRITMWRFAVRVANDHPIVGGGFDVFYHEGYRAAYLEEGEEGRAVHSIYFEALGEHGYVGLFLFLLLGFATFRSCGALANRVKGIPELKWVQDLAPMIQVSVIGYASAGIFLNLATFDFYYHLIAMTVITSAIVTRHIQAKEGATETTTAAPLFNLPVGVGPSPFEGNIPRKQKF